ncbi:uncharacterized protein LOC129759449 [Uranotaenia lowii]|uniref:uncharacterized protein LOC129759449 n=1 Tax=Uranotaenia lowii TaxID=190385 RepID=UPI00247AECC7|nr:uncharacterized protein LOC129759449 [Uranotaenia lowii]
MAGKDPDPPDDRGSFPAWMANSENDGILRILLLRVVSEDDDKRPPLPHNPFLISRSVEAIVGYRNRHLVSAIREEKGNRYVLRTQSPEIYSKLCKMTHLLDAEQTRVEVVDHPTFSFTKGVVYEPDTKDMSDNDLLKELSREGVTAVKWITTKDKQSGAIKNTPLVVLTFKGTKRPTHILFGMLRISVRPYYPSVLQCRSCAAYGHTRKHCSSEAVCFNCSQKHTLDNDQECPNPAYCYHCEGAHSPISKSCPVFRKEEAVVRIKVDKGLTYREAREQIDRTSPQISYSSQVQNRLNEHSDNDREIQLLHKEVDKLRNQLKDFSLLKSQLEALQTVHQAALRTNQELGNSQVTNKSTNEKPEAPSKTRISRKDSGKKSSCNQQKAAETTTQHDNQTPVISHRYPSRSISRKRFQESPPTKYDRAPKKIHQESPVEDVRMLSSEEQPSDDDFDD